MRWTRFIGPALAVMLPLALFFGIKENAAIDPQLVAPRGHFYIVSVVSMLAVVIAAAVGIAGRLQRNIKVTFLSLAFISLGIIFTVHGLSTPGFLIDEEHLHLPSISSQMSIVFASFWLWMSSLPTNHLFVGWLSRWHKGLLPAWTAFITSFGIVGLMNPNLVNVFPVNTNPLNGTVAAAVVMLNAYSLYVFMQSYRYSRFPIQLSMVYSSAWIIVAQLIMTLGDNWHLSWWMYHFMLLASVCVMVGGLIKQQMTGQSIGHAVKSLFATDPIERITGALSPSVKALILATESKDTYTAGHNFRVAVYALRLGQEMGLPPEKLRALAQGAVVHDVGKIQIPDEILNKPGKLTDQERAIIEQHPVSGFEMCKSLGFLREEMEIIRSHHERWDGQGYPDRLAGEQIPPMARIVAVADVYDALTSSRSYRQAWTHEQAIRLLEENKGTQFDPACVDAWLRLCVKDPNLKEYPSVFEHASISDLFGKPQATNSI